MSDMTAELLARYASGERAFQETEIDDPDALALYGAILMDIDFSRSFLVATFRNADLRNASFRDANIKTCDFTGADLTGADFRGAALDATTFKRAVLTGARFAGAHLQGHAMAEDELPDW